jgi:putative transposase
MKKAYKYRFYPNKEQEDLLRRTIGCCRFVYNRSLSIRSEAWLNKKESVSGVDLKNMLPVWKREEETAWLREVSSISLQQSINDLDVAFQNFFTKKAKYPNFKKKSSGGTCRFTVDGFRIKDGEVWIAKTKAPLDIKWSRPLPEGVEPSRCTVRLTPSCEWYISFLCDVVINHLPKIDKKIGLDMGITALVTTSDGEKITNPKTSKKYRDKLAVAQKRLSKKVKGSSNYKRAKLKVARIHQKISDTRNDHLHKLTTRLVHENQVIVIEDLSIRNMLKNHCLAGSISDASWNSLKNMIEYKCNWYGRELVVIDKWFPSSKMCSKCGSVVKKLPLSVRSWRCPNCGTEHDRDINAARNIISAGTVDYTCGGAVSQRYTKCTDAGL